jgi:hypothetical protein
LSERRNGASEKSPRFLGCVCCKEDAEPVHQVRCITCSTLTLVGMCRPQLISR